jgi:hypothetical protein
VRGIVKVSFEVFICHKKSSGGTYAENLKDALWDIGQIKAFVASKDLPNWVEYSAKWREFRNKAILGCQTFLMLVTYGFETSPEIIDEIKLARTNTQANFMVFRWKSRDHNILVNLGDEVLPLQKYNQLPFSDLGELVNGFFDKYPRLETKRTNELPLETPKDTVIKAKENETPLVNYKITQSIQNTNIKRRLPDVGFNITNWNSYPLKAKVQARVILAGNDLGLIKGSERMGKYLGYYDGETTWNLNPYIHFFGHFSLPAEYSRNPDNSLTIEVKVSLEDLKGQKFEYLPVCWTYDKDSNDWFYEPTGDC